MRKAAQGLGFLSVGVLTLICVVWGDFIVIPRRNTTQERFDALLVLGSPTNPDGKPSPEQRTRVTAAAQEYRAGRAPVVIVSGGAAHNGYVEADTMARLALDAGVPKEAVVEERAARNTMENICLADAILRQRRARSVEVVSSPSHLPRAALILEHYQGLAWKTYAAAWPSEFLHGRIATIFCYEALECFRLRVFGFPRSRCLPA